jgi:hypothetical protein
MLSVNQPVPSALATLTKAQKFRALVKGCHSICDAVSNRGTPWFHCIEQVLQDLKSSVIEGRMPQLIDWLVDRFYFISLFFYFSSPQSLLLEEKLKKIPRKLRKNFKDFITQ